MKRLWPKVKTTTIVSYLVIITVVSVIANIFMQMNVADKNLLSAEDVAGTEITEIDSIEITMGNILYDLPQSQFQRVLETIAPLKPANLFNNDSQLETSCTIMIGMKDNSKINLLVKKKEQHPQMVFMELKKEKNSSLSENGYLAEELCERLIE